MQLYSPRRSLWALSLGIILGASFTLMMRHIVVDHLLTNHKRNYGQVDMPLDTGRGLLESRERTFNISEIIPHLARTPEKLHAGEDELASQLFDHIRIACWVMTQPKNHGNRLHSALATWGRRCNQLFVVSTATVVNQTTALYTGRESRNVLWGKTKLGFQYAYDNYFDEADWFLKADDDTYLVMENLRLLLFDKDPAKPLFYGCKFKPFVRQGYMSGGAGYVLSREALKRFIEKGLPDRSRCRQDDNGAEDAEMGKCLQNVGVEAADSRDPEGRARFFPFAPQKHVSPGQIDSKWWYWKYIWYKHEQGVHCCSDSAIAFHYIDIHMMWTMEYLIYHLHPFGIHPQLAGTDIKNDVIAFLEQEPGLRSKIKKGTNSTSGQYTLVFLKKLGN